MTDEHMIKSASDKMACLNYAAFVEKRPTIREWLDPLEQQPQEIREGGQRRLTQLQHLLVQLTRQLNEHQIRYPVDMETA